MKDKTRHRNDCRLEETKKTRQKNAIWYLDWILATGTESIPPGAKVMKYEWNTNLVVL